MRPSLTIALILMTSTFTGHVFDGTMRDRLAERKIRALERQFIDALAESDTAKLDQVLSQDISITRRSPVSADMTEFSAALAPFAPVTFSGFYSS